MAKKMTVVQFQTELEKIGVISSKIDEIVSVILGDKSDVAKDELLGNFYDIATASINDPRNLNGIRASEIVGIVETSKKEIEIRNHNEDVINNKNNLDAEELRQIEEQRKKEEEFKARLEKIDFSKPLDSRTFGDIANNYDIFVRTASLEAQKAVITEIYGESPENSVLLAMSKLAMAEAELRDENPELQEVNLNKLLDEKKLNNFDMEAIKHFIPTQEIEDNKGNKITKVRSEDIISLGVHIAQLQNDLRVTVGNIIEQHDEQGTTSKLTVSELMEELAARLPEDFSARSNSLGVPKFYLLRQATRREISLQNRPELKDLETELSRQLKIKSESEKINEKNLVAVSRIRAKVARRVEEFEYFHFEEVLEQGILSEEEVEKLNSYGINPEELQASVFMETLEVSPNFTPYKQRLYEEACEYFSNFEPDMGFEELDESEQYDEIEDFSDEQQIDDFFEPESTNVIQEEVGNNTKDIEDYFDNEFDSIKDPFEEAKSIKEGKLKYQDQKIDDFDEQPHQEEPEYQAPQIEVPDEEVEKVSRNPFARFAARVKRIFSKDKTVEFEKKEEPKLLEGAQKQIDEGNAKQVPVDTKKKRFGIGDMALTDSPVIAIRNSILDLFTKNKTEKPKEPKETIKPEIVAQSEEKNAFDESIKADVSQQKQAEIGKIAAEAIKKNTIVPQPVKVGQKNGEAR